MRLIDADKLIARLNYCVKEGLGETIAHTFRHMIEDAPTENEWIPVIERLPEKYGMYLCSVPMDEEYTAVEILTYGKPVLPMNSGDGVGWYYTDSEGDYYWDGVTAWMPLPPAYKGGDIE